MRGPRELRKLELLRDGEAVSASTKARPERSVNAISLETKLRIEQSTWLAARGEGGSAPIPAGSEVAHTAAIQVIVGNEPIWSETDGRVLIDRLEEQKRFYAKTGRYAKEEHRWQMLALFDRAIAELRGKLAAREKGEPTVYAPIQPVGEQHRSRGCGRTPTYSGLAEVDLTSLENKADSLHAPGKSSAAERATWRQGKP